MRAKQTLLMPTTRLYVLFSNQVQNDLAYQNQFEGSQGNSQGGSRLPQDII